VRTTVVQQARSAEYGALLDLTQTQHQAYAERHGMEYVRVDGAVAPPSWSGHWDQIQLLVNLLNDGAGFVFWLDADTLIVDLEADLHEGLGEGQLAMTRHPGPPAHWNCGVLLARNTPQVRGFFAQTLALGPGEFPWYQQKVMNHLLARAEWRHLISRLDDRWNATFGVTEVARPAVVAWHDGQGAASKLVRMKAYLREHGHGGELPEGGEGPRGWWIEVKTIKGRRYRYKRWRENGRTRSLYLGKAIEA
jgi:hypothetical protein